MGFDLTTSELLETNTSMQIELVAASEEGLRTWRAWRTSDIAFLILNVPDGDCRVLEK
jgi:hypothetical protein